MSQMMFNIHINQVKALEWQLNAQQALVFSLVHQLPTWADVVHINGESWYHLSKQKLVDELPILTDKPDTAWRYLKQLVEKGVIEMTTIQNRTHIRVTEIGLEWNRGAADEAGKVNSAKVGRKSKGRKNFRGSEANPNLGNESEGGKDFQASEKSPGEVGKISEPGSEKFPTDYIYQDHTYQDQGKTHCANPCATPSPDHPADSTPDSEPSEDSYRTAKGKLLSGEALENFLTFWEAFGYRKDKARAADAWLNVPWYGAATPNAKHRNWELLMQIVTGAANEARQRQHKQQAGVTPIYAEGWLNARRWEDEDPDLMAQRAALRSELGGGSTDPKAKRDRIRQSLQNIHDTSWAEPLMTASASPMRDVN